MNYSKVADHLIHFIKEETEKRGFSNLVVGLSGGIDSALSAVLAVKAIGKDRLYAFSLPYKTSSKESIEDAKLVADKFGINLQVIEITPFVDPFIEKLGVDDRVRKGNIMARVRMITLFDMSSKYRALVLGTSNKTEILLGYGTVCGDIASAINPLGDLYKTDVWGLSKYLGIPDRLIEKKPTADLWSGQTDEGELGFTYLEVDKLLHQMIDRKLPKDELVKIGFKEEFILQVQERVEKNKFKSELPKIAKIDNLL